ncbi:MAG: hypothetical protein COW75_05070 [Rhodobacterales bacterium CG18_big_fil_WC_8_21_14_2_50_71_9]|nr:MAG: hypothetical protein COW75_05070 [Rhodobacterales bacterium CG18_big_fil_WC_8_21_14_2_50_71_9]PJA59651.1 MAG: hypothetical protein CO163_08210 [Rhodobacterales bacterium CG_4_9_14_3_um_filter_71_31]
MARAKPSAASAAASVAVPRVFALPESLDAAAAPGLLDSLRSLRGGPVEINAAQVKRLGGQCAQVLLSAAATWRADKARLTLIEPSPELAEALRLMGLTPDSLTDGDAAA